jgi:sugar phosphate isomerase/epimerase
MRGVEASRRALLGGGAALAAMSLVGSGAMAAAKKAAMIATSRNRKPGIQLYTIRSEMQKDVPGSLKKMADVGYKEVEFAGYFGHSPAEIRKMVADLGLTAPSSHIQGVTFIDDPQQTIDAALAAGHQWLVLPWVKPELRTTIDQWKTIADICNKFAVHCQAAGLRFGYHNHDFEFAPIGGVLPYDVLMQSTDPALVQFELDMYWAKRGGQDLASLMAKHRGRMVMVHVKDMLPNGAMTDVGLGDIPFAQLLAAPAATPIEHYFVENDDTTTPFESAAISCKALTQILAGLP